MYNVYSYILCYKCMIVHVSAIMNICTYVQVDLTCRKSWDTYVQRLETVDVDPETGSEVIHWIMAFPVSLLHIVTLE